VSAIPGKPSGVPVNDPSVTARFWSKVDRTGQCHLWTGHVTKNGYGRWTWCVGRAAYAHRVAWEIARGNVPTGLVIDHICRNRRCVNVDHMRVATIRENVLSGESGSARNAAKSSCVHGHAFTPENTYRLSTGGRHCRACKRDRDLRAHASTAS
jgi:hypothetical protein